MTILLKVYQKIDCVNDFERFDLKSSKEVSELSLPNISESLNVKTCVEERNTVENYNDEYDNHHRIPYESSTMREYDKPYDNHHRIPCESSTMRE